MIKRWLLMPLLLSATPLFAADPEPDPDYPPAAAEVVVPSQGARLPGLMYLANGQGPHPTVVLLHGFPGNERNLDVAQELRRSGFNTLFFSYRGAWGSEGEYAVSHLAEDALAALAFLRSDKARDELRVDAGKLSLLGHSFGGWTALAAASSDDQLACVAALAPAELATYADGLRAEDPRALGFSAYAERQFMLAGLTAEKVNKFLLDTPREQLDLKAFGPRLADKAVLVIAGEQDTVTPPVTMFSPVVDAYGKVDGMKLEAHLISGDHSFSWSRLKLSDLIRDWMLRNCG